MSLKILRNDITRMETDIIVNTANNHPTVGTGCDHAIYQAAGYEELLRYRIEHIGEKEEGDVFVTPAFHLKAQYIIHAVSPHYIDGQSGEEEKLRRCYRDSLRLAAELGVSSIAFPLIATGGFGYPKEEGFRIALDEINSFLMKSDLAVILVVFGAGDTRIGRNLYPALESYIDQNYVEESYLREYAPLLSPSSGFHDRAERSRRPSLRESLSKARSVLSAKQCNNSVCQEEVMDDFVSARSEDHSFPSEDISYGLSDSFLTVLDERMAHVSDTFSEYLIYLIDSRGMSYPDVYKRALVDKKAFSKIKNNPDYHPKKMTALCLCIGAKLNMDQSRDLLARAGYALSPCDKTDIIFSFFIENKIYDMVELDLQLEEHGLPYLIS